MKVALLVRSLERGGAERQLVMLATVLKRVGIDVVVIAFYGGGPFERDLTDAGVRVKSLGKASRWDLAAFTLRLFDVIRSERPDVLYGFVVTPNLLASAIRPFFRKMRVVWGIRSARMDLSAYDWLTRVVYGLEGHLSALPDLIIVNSVAGRSHLQLRGFPSNKVAYVPNGIDVDRYHPDADGRSRLRQIWGIEDSESLVGIVARADPVKAHEVFVGAIKLLSVSDPQLKFVCIGVDEASAARIRAQAERLGVSARLRIEGPRDDLAAVYSALDVHVMCSHSEGFPNVVAEAMACEVPCVVTEVGDAVEIIGIHGEHVPSADPVALSGAILALLARISANPRGMKSSARARIVEEYSLDALAARTLRELSQLLTAPQ